MPRAASHGLFLLTIRGPSWAWGMGLPCTEGWREVTSVWPAQLMLTQKHPFQRALYPWGDLWVLSHIGPVLPNLWNFMESHSFTKKPPGAKQCCTGTEGTASEVVSSRFSLEEFRQRL